MGDTSEDDEEDWDWKDINGHGQRRKIGWLIVTVNVKEREDGNKKEAQCF